MSSKEKKEICFFNPFLGTDPQSRLYCAEGKKEIANRKRRRIPSFLCRRGGLILQTTGKLGAPGKEKGGGTSLLEEGFYLYSRKKGYRKKKEGKGKYSLDYIKVS